MIINLIANISLGVLFITSEVLPFIRTVKSNGLLEALISIFYKEEEEPSREELFNIEDAV